MRRRKENGNHLCCNGARDGKLDVDVHLGGLVLEVDGGEVLVVRLGEVEGELVVDGQVICERERAKLSYKLHLHL